MTDDSPSDRTLADAVRAIIQSHYADEDGSTRPLLLSQLGLKLSDAQRDQMNMSLRQFLNANMAEEVGLVAAPSTPQKIAVAPLEWLPQVRRTLLGGEFRLEDFSFPVLVAFCKEVSDGEHMYLRPASPHRYEVLRDDDPPEDFIRVDKDLRRPGTNVSQPAKLSKSLKESLVQAILEWANRHEVDIDELRGQPRSPKPSTSTALERLVEAQAPDIRTRVVIPADIALLLAKTI